MSLNASRIAQPYRRSVRATKYQTNILFVIAVVACSSVAGCIVVKLSNLNWLHYIKSTKPTFIFRSLKIPKTSKSLWCLPVIRSRSLP